MKRILISVMAIVALSGCTMRYERIRSIQQRQQQDSRLRASRSR